MLRGASRIPKLADRRWASSTESERFDPDVVARNHASLTADAARAGWHVTSESNPPIRLVLPPPNVTGQLHLGHALAVALQDAIVRFARMEGRQASWLPGFDHAGIATQAVVERELWRERRQLRRHLSRTQFEQRCRQHAARNTTAIRDQLSRLGATLDWGAEFYTLDDRFSSAVTHAFCELYRMGKIERRKRMIHWCPNLQSSLSDQEVDWITASDRPELRVPTSEGGTKLIRLGQMHRIRYVIIKEGRLSDEWIEVATTRPETVFADVALAVHPQDPRYNRLIGETVRHPLLRGRLLPIVADEAVQPDKGTGVLKLTPSHDPLDFAICQRHIEEIEAVDKAAMLRSVIDEAGRLHSIPGYINMDRFEAREKVLKELAKVGCFGGSTDFPQHTVGVCSRSGDLVEPLLREQWFLDTREADAKIVDKIRRGEIRFSAHTGAALHWLENSEPWCLSRQLLWGHRVPAFRRVGEAYSNDWMVEENREAAAKFFGVPESEAEQQIRQDLDVLDTWFSSALVPLVTSGWPTRRDFPPQLLTLLETGHDILGFWALRQLSVTEMLSHGKSLAFPLVLLHGLVRDAAGRKMSKSLGNVVDPRDVLDGITLEAMLERLDASALDDKEKERAATDMRSRHPKGLEKRGADALRFALLRQDAFSGHDVPLDVDDESREGALFANKLTNLVNYARSVKAAAEELDPSSIAGHASPMDRWLHAKWRKTLRDDVFGAMQIEQDERGDGVRPHRALRAIHDFLLHDVADLYVESTKFALWGGDASRLSEISRTLNVDVLPDVLHVLSVFMPFVAEHLWRRVTGKLEPTGEIHRDKIQCPGELDRDEEELLESVAFARRVISAARALRKQLALPVKNIFPEELRMDVRLSVSRKENRETGERARHELEQLVAELGGIRIVGILMETDEDPQKGHLPWPVYLEEGSGAVATMLLKMEPTLARRVTEDLTKRLNLAVQKIEHYERQTADFSTKLATEDPPSQRTERALAGARSRANTKKAEAEQWRRLLTAIGVDVRKTERATRNDESNRSEVETGRQEGHSIV